MKIFICILIIFFLIILFLLFKKFSVEIKKENDRTVVRVGVKYFKIKIFDSSVKKEKKPETEKKEDMSKSVKPKKKKSFKSIKNRILALKKLYIDEKDFIKMILSQLKSAIEISKFDYSMRFGFGDAAITGIANGFFWNVVTFVINILEKFFEIKKISNIAILPEFTENVFETKYTVEFSGRFYKFIKPTLNIRKFLKRNKKTLDIIKDGE